MASLVRQTAWEILLEPDANWWREMVWCSVFLSRPARIPERILKSVCNRDSFLLSLILVEFSLLIFGVKDQKGILHGLWEFACLDYFSDHITEMVAKRVPADEICKVCEAITPRRGIPVCGE